MVLGKETIAECPISYIQPASTIIFDLFWLTHYFSDYGGILRSALPEAGGLLDQDAHTMQAFKVIEQETKEAYSPSKKTED